MSATFYYLVNHQTKEAYCCGYYKTNSVSNLCPHLIQWLAMNPVTLDCVSEYYIDHWVESGYTLVKWDKPLQSLVKIQYTDEKGNYLTDVNGRQEPKVTKYV